MASSQRTVSWENSFNDKTDSRMNEGTKTRFGYRPKSALASNGLDVNGNNTSATNGLAHQKTYATFVTPGRAQDRNGSSDLFRMKRVTSPGSSKPFSQLNGEAGNSVKDKYGRPVQHSQHGQHVQKRRQLLNPRIVRPLSAPPTQDKTKNRKPLPRSANSRERSRKISSTYEEIEMEKVVKKAVDRNTFDNETDYFRQVEKSIQEQESAVSDATPVFNKRIFASQGTVIITREARRMMCLNAKENRTGNCDRMISKSEATSLRCVTDGLKLIHKGEDFVKDVLARVVTFEIYRAFEYVPIQDWEETLSCYFVLNGAVEVTYDMQQRESRNVYQPNIIYSHGTGEYLGLVSPEGAWEDLTPPATIYTKELTQFIRIDRTRFHKLMAKATQMMNKRKLTYMCTHSFLSHVSDEVREKILTNLTIQDYPANRVLLAQDERSEFIYIVMSGRCLCYREVFIPEAGKEVLFYLESREPDDFFGEECLLDRSPSYCTVVTATASTCLKLHKSAMQIVNRERLTRFIEEARHELPSDNELRERGYKNSIWSRYKHGQIKCSLKEGGKLKYLCSDQHEPVHDRPPCNAEQYTENMYRFIMKGSDFEPMCLRAQSAIPRKTEQGNRVALRPQTAAPALGSSVKNGNDEHDQPDPTSQATETKEEDVKPSGHLMTAAKARDMEKHLTLRGRFSLARLVRKAMESKESMMNMLEDNPALREQFKHGWADKTSEEKENFMKNGVLVTMRTEDIVRKAKALADTYADKWKKSSSTKDEEEWDTILHAENKQAKLMITANRIRINDIKRRMTQLQKHREKLGLVTKSSLQQDDLHVEEFSPRDRSPVRDEVTGQGHTNTEGQGRTYSDTVPAVNTTAENKRLNGTVVEQNSSSTHVSPGSAVRTKEEPTRTMTESKTFETVKEVDEENDNG